MWFDVQTSNIIGGILGAAAGVSGGILGTVAGLFARKGKFEKFVLLLSVILMAFGAILLCVGGIALTMRQPFHVWYPFTLIGSALIAVIFPNDINLKKIYAKAKLDNASSKDVC